VFCSRFLPLSRFSGPFCRFGQNKIETESCFGNQADLPSLAFKGFIMHVFSRRAAALFMVLGCLDLATANERHFGYTYETATLPRGAKELEVWTTSALGRDQYYSRLDHSAEFEFGVAKYVMAAFYLNWSDTTGYHGGDLESGSTWNGFATEIKVQLSDPAASVIGSGLYLEASYGTHEFGLEGKALFDKNLGKVTLAANVVGEMVWEPTLSVATADDRNVQWKAEEFEFSLNLAAAYDLGHGFSAGVEFMNQNGYAQANDAWDLEASTFFLGPTLGYVGKSWWTTLTVLPQLPAAKTEGDSIFDLNDHERMQIRLLLSLHL
jgi:hypothetical protein